METFYDIDPTGHYKTKATMQGLLDSCGLIPLWVKDNEDTDLDFEEIFQACYQFGIYEMQDSKIVDGLFVSEHAGDPDLYPYIRIKRGEEIMFQYPYALVGIIRADGSQFLTRMD